MFIFIINIHRCKLGIVRRENGVTSSPNLRQIETWKEAENFGGTALELLDLMHLYTITHPKP